MTKDGMKSNPPWDLYSSPSHQIGMMCIIYDGIHLWFYRIYIPSNVVQSGPLSFFLLNTQDARPCSIEKHRGGKHGWECPALCRIPILANYEFAGQPSLFDGAKTESEPSDGEPQKCTILGVGFLRFFTPLFCEFMPLSPVPATVYYFQHFFSKT